MYHIRDGHISATTITPLPQNKEQVERSNSGTSETQKSEENSSQCNKNLEKSVASSIDTKGQEKNAGSSFTSNSGEKEDQSKDGYQKNSTTESRTCLIPRNISYKITDQRTIDLLEELQSTNIKGHRNLIALGFRALIEFSVCVYIETKCKNYNNKKDLLDKIRYTVSSLESTYGQNKLKNVIPKIYQLLNTETPTSQFGDIAMFNLFAHQYKFHPQEEELKVIYNNYEPYLQLLWNEINKK